MKFDITYSLPTAGGNTVTRTVVANTKADAEVICELIESLEGYKLVDIGRSFDD